MRIRIVTAIPLLLAACAAAQAGSYYKWTDGQGTVHYSQTPPPDQGSKPVYINDGNSQPLPTGMDTATETPKQQAHAQATEMALDKANTQALKSNCDAAKRNIALLDSKSIVAHPEASDVRALTPEQRQQALVDARKQAATYCEGKP